MNRKMHGFSLIELMVTIAIMAILSMIAIPAFRNMTRRNDVTTSTNALLADLSYARTEAVSRGLFVSVCPSSDGQTCQASTTFDQGWLVYTYTPGNAKSNTVYSSTNATNLLLRATVAQHGVSMISQDNSTNNSVISFDNQGQQKAVAGNATELDTIVCYRDSGTGAGTSTGPAQGSVLMLYASGGISTKALATGSSCTP